MPNAKAAVLVFLELGTSGDEAKFARPSNRHFVGCEFRRVAEMGIPAFSGADEQHAVSRIFDHITPIVKMKSEGEAWCWTFRKDNIHKIVAARAALLQAHSLILKKL